MNIYQELSALSKSKPDLRSDEINTLVKKLSNLPITPINQSTNITHANIIYALILTHFSTKQVPMNLFKTMEGNRGIQCDIVRLPQELVKIIACYLSYLENGN